MPSHYKEDDIFRNEKEDNWNEKKRVFMEQVMKPPGRQSRASRVRYSSEDETEEEMKGRGPTTSTKDRQIMGRGGNSVIVGPESERLITCFVRDLATLLEK